MLRTRLWMGAVLVALVAGMLAVDQRLGPWRPFLFVFVLALALVACRELRGLLGGERCQPAGLWYAAVTALVVVNWPAHVLELKQGPWHWVLGAFTAVVLAAFLVEMLTFREPGVSVLRIALTVWAAAYLGLLPSFFAQLAWLKERGTGALALAVFVPKACDIGAYTAGRLLGRHQMTPMLSPKKTWEGLAGGLLAAAAAGVGLNRLLPALPGDAAAAGFGLTVGGAGVLGDLAESLVKRDCQRKDASQVVPGFGGVLDVVDSVVFAAPVAYAWMTWFPPLAA